MMTIRPATPADLPAINAIYNHYVLTSTATYQTVPSTEAQRRDWFAGHGARHPVFVAQLGADDASIVGWSSLSPFHARAAFDRTVENSVYVHPDHLRQGHGQKLLGHLIDMARGLDHHAIVALIDSEQGPSLALHGRHGFGQVGRLPQVGRKFGRWLDLVYMQLIL